MGKRNPFLYLKCHSLPTIFKSTSNNLKVIIDYLENRWTKREIRKFAQLLDKQLKLIENNPFLFAESGKLNGVRKSVLSRQTTIYYQITDLEVRIISLFVIDKTRINYSNKTSGRRKMLG